MSKNQPLDKRLDGVIRSCNKCDCYAMDLCHITAVNDAKERIITLERELAEAKAQLTAANATIAACKEAGFIDAEGRVRKVAHDMSLPITADGYIAMYGETYWYWDTINGYSDPIEYGWTQRELESCRPQDAEYSWTTNPSLCYYDLDAAKASKQKGQP